MNVEGFVQYSKYEKKDLLLHKYYPMARNQFKGVLLCS